MKLKINEVRADSLALGDCFSRSKGLYMIIDNNEVMDVDNKHYPILVLNLETSKTDALAGEAMVVPVEVEAVEKGNEYAD